jgi:hypothetical protein
MRRAIRVLHLDPVPRWARAIGRADPFRHDAFEPEPAGVLPHCTLSPVCGLVSVWAAEGREIDRARRALRLQRLKVSDREDPFGAVIRCTADPAKADKRTRSKWSRAMRYAAAYKPDSEALDQFIQRKGGINACAARFSRRLGRHKATRSERRSARG